MQRALVAEPRPRTGRSRTTGCGRSAARCGTSPTPGSWCGRRSTARSAASRSGASTARSSSGASCATRCATRSSTKGFDAERNTFTQHYDTDRGRRLAAAHPAGAASCRPTTRGSSARSAAIEQDLMRDGLPAALPHRDRGRRPRGRRAPVPGLLVVAGERVCRVPASSTKARDLMDRLVALFNDVGPDLRGVRPPREADGRQLPAGLLAPHLHRRRPRPRPGRGQGRAETREAAAMTDAAADLAPTSQP